MSANSCGTGLGADPLDAIILASAGDQWCKVAVFIAQVMDAAKAQSLEASGQAIASRIYALCAEGRLDAQGNVRRWRNSSVRHCTGSHTNATS